MKFEKLNYSSGNVKKAFIIGFLVCALVFVIINLFFTRAKYQLTESIPIVRGTINYKQPDLNIIAMYQQKTSGNTEDSNYEQIDTAPTNGYVVNTTKSYCTISNGEKDNTIKYNFENGYVYVGFKNKGTKCYLYLDIKGLPVNEAVLAERKIIAGQVSFTGYDKTAHTTNGKSDLFTGEDDLGTTYYFRGVVNDNWVKFGKTTAGLDLYWRIIRINGNGSIRMIYNGTSMEQTGDTTQVTKEAFNSISDNNMYVGFMYGIDSNSYAATHTNDNKSTILTKLESWFVNDTNLDDLIVQLDKEAGFCNDRQVIPGAESNSIGGNGTGTLKTSYASAAKLMQNGYWRTTQYANFKCGVNAKTLDEVGTVKTVDAKAQARDLFTVSESSKGNHKLTYPVGFITSDEAIFAGGFSDAYSDNSDYYLYTNSAYWTMSPFSYESSNAKVCVVSSNGSVGRIEVKGSYGVRPVINISSNAQISGSGTILDPYIIF